LISEQTQKVVEKNAETERKRKNIEAQSEAEIADINNKKNIMEREARQKIELIENQIQFEKKKSAADSEHYQAMKEAEANQVKFTEEYMKIKFFESIQNNLKFYFGQSIPAFLSENMTPLIQKK